MSVEITTLPSGLRIVTDRMPHLETVSLGVWVAAGSRHERPRERGLSHLLEHMAFKGTRRRSARDIAEEIESAGGDLNAATSVEQTAYYAHVLAGDVGLAIDILSDILTDSVFDKEELEREKEVILQEIGAVEDTPDDLVFDLFNAAAFPEQPIGWPILGTPEHVRAFDRSMIATYLDKHYRSGVTAIGAAGALDHARIVEAAAARFANLPAQAHEDATPARYVGGDMRVSRRLEQAHIVIGFEGLSYAAPTYYALHVFANAVGGGMSSRLFQEVREKRGLCYSIYAFHWGFSDSGIFGVHAATGPDDVPELMPVMLGELERAAHDIDGRELDRARAQLRAGLLMTLESPAGRAGQIARQMLLFGRPIPTDELVARINAITVDDVRNLAGDIFTGSKPTVAAVGALSGMIDHDKVAERFGFRARAAVAAAVGA